MNADWADFHGSEGSSPTETRRLMLVWEIRENDLSICDDPLNLCSSAFYSHWAELLRLFSNGFMPRLVAGRAFFCL